ncbi:MAG: ribosome-associated translation inhibitor RaiA [Bdellovibrionota bacterium]
MRVHITFKQMDATEAIKLHVQEKSERLDKFVSDAIEANWVLFVEADNHVADLRVHGPHIDYFAQAKTPDLYQSIDEVVEKIEKQLRKHKEIVKDHLHRNRASSG